MPADLDEAEKPGGAGQYERRQRADRKQAGGHAQRPRPDDHQQGERERGRGLEQEGRADEVDVAVAVVVEVGVEETADREADADTHAHKQIGGRKALPHLSVCSLIASICCPFW
ncbi:hypothetical protein ACFYO1_35775 [Nocardia sp. NPDC006044]|uniref:hypothetical protein n=1 Tax=Nocardia sp. NPDC006044 TaxID=3364306 RepID=UPI00367E2B6C